MGKKYVSGSELDNSDTGVAIYLDGVRSLDSDTQWEEYPAVKIVILNSSWPSERYAKADRDKIENYQMLHEGIRRGIVPPGIFLTEHVMPDKALWSLGEHALAAERLLKKQGSSYVSYLSLYLFNGRMVDRINAQYPEVRASSLGIIAVDCYPAYPSPPILVSL